MSDTTSWVLSAFADEAGNSCDEQIQALQKAGLKFLDIRNIEGFTVTALPLDTARDIKKRLDDAGIEVNMFGTPIGKIDIADDFETDLKRLQHIGELAPILGCNQARIFSYFNQSGQPHEEWQRESLRRLSMLRDVAKQLGLKLYHENERHIYGDLCRDVQVIAREVRDGENFFFIFDFDNYNQSEENVWENWTQLREVTDAFHLKDSTAQKEHVPSGQGNGKIREILSDARARGWSGSLSLEPHLTHSGAVATTGPGGVANQQYGKMPPADSFHVAAGIARELIEDIGAELR